MSKMEDAITGMILGIRYARSFRIPDVSGEIIDEILYSKDSPFSAEFFSKMQESSTRERTLYNPDNHEYLRINSDDIILGIKVDTGKFNEKMNWIIEKVIPYFSNQLFQTFHITNIKRVGIVFSHRIEKKNKTLDNAVKKTTGGKIKDADDIALNFSKKLDTELAHIRRGVNDYRNTIYSIKSDGNSIFADLDYQYYYEPAVEDLRDCSIDDTLNKAKIFLTNEFHDWLKEYAVEEKS